jgi:hypothetical protein
MKEKSGHPVFPNCGEPCLAPPACSVISMSVYLERFEFVSLRHILTVAWVVFNLNSWSQKIYTDFHE